MVVAAAAARPHAPSHQSQQTHRSQRTQRPSRVRPTRTLTSLCPRVPHHLNRRLSPEARRRSPPGTGSALGSRYALGFRCALGSRLRGASLASLDRSAPLCRPMPSRRSATAIPWPPLSRGGARPSRRLGGRTQSALALAQPSAASTRATAHNPYEPRGGQALARCAERRDQGDMIRSLPRGKVSNLLREQMVRLLLTLLLSHPQSSPLNHSKIGSSCIAKRYMYM